MEAEVRESDTKDGRPDTSEEANQNKDNKAEMVREPESSNQIDYADGGSDCNSTNQKEEMTTIESKSTNPAKETLANGDCSDISENNKSVELNSKKDSQNEVKNKEAKEQDSSPSSRGVNSNINSNADDTARQGGKSPKKSVRIADEPVKLFHIPRFLEMDRKLPQKAEQQLRSFIHSKDSKHLKQWLRSHHWPVDHPIRSNLWLLTCKFVFKSQSSIYHEMLEDLFREDMPELLPLPPFVDTDYVPQYCLTEAGVQTVHTILVILDQLNPDVTYCPTLFPLAALFMHFMEPEDCFNCLYSMIRTTESRYLAQTNVAVDATYLVMRDLARHHAKSAYSSIVKDTDGNVEPVFKNWTWWIFIYLPFPILVQVMDCYLFEGMKVLYRVALAILILFQKHTAKLHEPHSPLLGANVSARIKHFCEDMPYPIEKILKTAFGIRGLGRKELRKLQVRYEMYEKSQTVRMTRASSFARSVSRSSFSAPTPSRSMSIPAPISAKRAHAKGETVNQELDSDSDSESDTILTSNPIDPRSQGQMPKVNLVDHHSVQANTYQNQQTSVPKSINKDTRTPELKHRRVHYDESRSSSDEKVMVCHSAQTDKIYEDKYVGDDEDKVTEMETVSTLTPDLYNRARPSSDHRSSAKGKSLLKHKHTILQESPLPEYEEDSDITLNSDPSDLQDRSRSYSYQNTKVRGRLKQEDYTTVEYKNGGPSVVTGTTFTSDLHSPHGRLKSQGQHSTKVKVKGRALMDHNNDFDQSAVVEPFDPELPSTSYADERSRPLSRSRQKSLRGHHAKIRAIGAFSLRGKKGRKKKQDVEEIVVSESSDSELPSTSTQVERSQPLSRSNQKSLRGHRAKIKAVGAFSLKGKGRKKQLVLEEEEILPPSSSSVEVVNGPKSRSLTHLHIEEVECFTLKHRDLMTIWSWIPARYTICQPQLLFTTELHGISLATLYRRLGEHEPTLFVIKTAKNEVFGAFCSTSWRERYQKGENRHLSYFGTGETFIFTLNPRRRAYYWVGLSTPDYPPTASMFLAGDHKTLMIGGGSGTAIHLDAGLVHCRTEKCDTFENEPLSSTPEFSCKVLEVFGFK